MRPPAGKKNNFWFLHSEQWFELKLFVSQVCIETLSKGQELQLENISLVLRQNPSVLYKNLFVWTAFLLVVWNISQVENGIFWPGYLLNTSRTAGSQMLQKQPSLSNSILPCSGTTTNLMELILFLFVCFSFNVSKMIENFLLAQTIWIGSRESKVLWGEAWPACFHGENPTILFCLKVTALFKIDYCQSHLKLSPNLRKTSFLQCLFKQSVVRV